MATIVANARGDNADFVIREVHVLALASVDAPPTAACAKIIVLVGIVAKPRCPSATL